MYFLEINPTSWESQFIPLLNGAALARNMHLYGEQQIYVAKSLQANTRCFQVWHHLKWGTNRLCIETRFRPKSIVTAKK